MAEWMGRQHGSPPATPASIAALATRPWRGGATDPCSICHGAFETGEVCMAMPCGHQAFHQECLRKWLQRHRTCPMCRAELPG